MNTSTFDERLLSLDSQIELCRNKAESAATALSEEAGRFLAAWTNEQVQGEVNRQSEVIISMGQKKVGELKSDLNKLCSELPEMAVSYFNESVHWAHREQIKSDSSDISYDYKFVGNRIPDKLDDPIRHLSGYCGKLLHVYGLLQPRGNWNREGAKAFQYTVGFNESPELKESIEKYVTALDELSKVASNREQILKKKSQAEAQNLWDQA